jgi:copper chaperone
MTTATITVAQIHCGGCENTIRTALTRVDGVRSVQPSQRTNQVRVAYDETIVGETDLRAHLSELGFEPTG